MNFKIRNVTPDDAESLLSIYKTYVLNTAITFEYQVPALAEFKSRISQTIKKYPYLCAEDNGKILGYAYASAFKERAAYQWSVELSIYIDKDSHGQGLGRSLYESLESGLKKMGIINLYACIAYPEKEDEYLSNNSLDFHSHMGFRKVGDFKNCAAKFGRWYHMTWMEKIIGEHKKNPDEVKGGSLPLAPTSLVATPSVGEGSGVAFTETRSKPVSQVLPATPSLPTRNAP